MPPIYNHFPVGYQPMQYAAPSYPPVISPTIAPQSPQQNNNGIIWVQGEAGAKAHLVGAGNSVLLMDSEGSYFYIKSTDMSGIPNLRKFSYEEILPVPRETKQAPTAAPAPIDTSNFITRNEFEERFAALTKPMAKPITRKEVKDE